MKKKMQKNKMKQLHEGTRVDGAGSLQPSWEPERVEPPAAEEEDFSASDENFIEHITAMRKKMKQLQEGTRVDGAGLQSSWEPERVEPPAAEEEDFFVSDENFSASVDNFIEYITAKNKKMMKLQEETHVDGAGLQSSWEPERVEPPAAEEEEWTAWTREKLFQEVREKLPFFSPRAEEEDFSASDEHFIEHITAKFEEFIMQDSVGADNSSRIYEELEKINYTELIQDFIAQESKRENAAEDFEEQAATSTMQPMDIEHPMEGSEIKEEAGTDKNHEQEEEGLDKKQEQEEEGLDKKQEQEEAGNR